jgi:type II secretory pathway pseudopilin PulG
MMKKEQHNSDRQNEAGFSLLELLLVVGVSAVIMVGAVSLSNGWIERIADKREARYFKTVMNAAEEYISVNFANIWTTGMGEQYGDVNGDGTLNNLDIVNLNRVIRIGMDTPAVGLPYFLEDASGSLPAAFPPDSPLGYQPMVYLRNLGYVGGVRTLEIFVMAESRNGKQMLSISRASNVARDIGPEGATISMLNLGNAGTPVASGFCNADNIITSIYGMWQVSMNVFSASPLNADHQYCPALQPNANNEGAYVGMRRVVEASDQILEGVLYRTAISGRPDANRMQANLDMNNFNVQNVNAITADRVDVQGTLSLNNENSSFYVDEVASIGGGLNVRADPTSSTGVPDPNCFWAGGAPSTLNPGATNPCDLQGGNVIISSGGGTVLRATGDLVANTARLNAANVNGNGDMVVGNQFLVENTTTINGNTQTAVMAGISPASTLNAGAINTSIMQASAMNSSGGVGANLNGGLVASSITATTAGLTANNLEVRSTNASNGVLQADTSLSVSQLLTADQATVDTLTACTSSVIHHYNSDSSDPIYGPNDMERNYSPTFDCSPGQGPPPPLGP